MKGPRERFASRERRFFGAFLGVLTVSLAMEASAATLSDKNSVITLDLGSSAGMTSWSVDGNNQVNQQWFWFRNGTSGPQFDISTINPTPTVSQLNARTLTALYANAQYGVQLTYTLSGGTLGTGNSKLTEQINFYNYSSSSSLDMHLFMYSDFSLGGPTYANAQNVSIGTGGGDTTVVQKVNGTGLSNNVAMPFAPANRVEAEAYPQTYNALTTTSGYSLDNTANNGPGHITWALEWDSVLAPNTSLGTISVTDTLQVPEPSAMALVVLGLGLSVWRGRTRKTA